MAETSYDYSISSDFPDGKVNTSRLAAEIGASIATQLVRADTAGGSVSGGVVTGGSISLVFANALTAPQKTALDADTTGPAGGLIAAHNNTEDQTVFRASSTTNSSTTSSVFQDKVTLQIPAGLTGTFRLGWYARMSNTDLGEVQLLDVTDQIVVDSVARKLSSDEVTTASGVKYVTLNGQAKTYKLQFRNVSGRKKQRVDDACIEFWGVA